MRPIISLQKVSKSFNIPHERTDSLIEFMTHPSRLFKKDRIHILKDISFDINKGEFVSIIGRNGSGKSTLLKILAGVYRADKGKVYVNGSLVPFLELGVGFHPELTARENIFLNGIILGMPRSYLKREFDNIVDFAGIREFVDLPVKNFSSGMYVRLAFSIAFKADADIYLLDEVMAVGDAQFKEKSLSVFERFKKQGKTIILVTHSMGFVRDFSDRVIYIKEGEVVANGDPEDVTKMYLKDMGIKDEDELLNIEEDNDNRKKSHKKNKRKYKKKHNKKKKHKKH